MTDKVRVRFAPSPTGSFHVGGARTALFNWLFARKNEGVFILRIEDTDKERSERKYEDEITESLKWLGLNWDEGPATAAHSDGAVLATNAENIVADRPDWIGKHGPYRQSERTGLYRKYLEKLLETGAAYYCYCAKDELEAHREAMLTSGLPPKYGGHCRNLAKAPAGKTAEAIRFKVPEARVEFKDMIRGNVLFDAALFGDMIIAKNLDVPLYNFAVVVDDALMEITHVIRGEDHLSNTPKQILMQNALGFTVPEYAHLPLILAQDRSKLSKRYAETSLLSYREEGYLPQAIVNFLALLGWHPKSNDEIFSISDLVREFDIKRTQKGGAVFQKDKLDWLNAQHLRLVDINKLAQVIAPEIKSRGIGWKSEKIAQILEAVRDRMATLNDFWELTDFFVKLPDYEPKLLIWQEDDADKTARILQEIKGLVESIKTPDLQREILMNATEEFMKTEGRGSVLWPFRVALSGKSVSPDPFLLAKIMGKSEVITRLNVAIKKSCG